MAFVNSLFNNLQIYEIIASFSKNYYTSIKISAGKLISTISIPDTIVKVGEENLLIPISAKFTGLSATISNISYRVEIHLNPTIFLPDFTTKGKLLKNTIENNKRILIIEDSNFTINHYCPNISRINSMS